MGWENNSAESFPALLLIIENHMPCILIISWLTDDVLSSTTPMLWCCSTARLQSYIISYFCTSLVYYIIQNVLENKKTENSIFI